MLLRVPDISSKSLLHILQPFEIVQYSELDLTDFQVLLQRLGDSILATASLFRETWNIHVKCKRSKLENTNIK